MNKIAAGLAGRVGLRVMARAARQRLTILIYHRVLPAPDPLRPGDPDVGMFAWQMDALADEFNVLSLCEAVDRLEQGRLPPRAAAITFDDGYVDNLELALPVLNARGLSATVFVATGFLNGGCMFNDAVIEVVRALPVGTVDLEPLGIESGDAPATINCDADRRRLIAALLPHFKHASLDRRAALMKRIEAWSQWPLPTDLMLTDRQVRELHEAGVEIGAHTVNHPILCQLSDDEAFAEMAESKRYLEALVQAPVQVFAYPNGRLGEDYTRTNVDQVRRLGFRAAVSTHPGTGGPESDRFQLPRFTPWDRTPDRFIARLALNAR